MPQVLLDLTGFPDFPEIQRTNIRNLVRCRVQEWWHLDVGLRDEGYSDFQIALVAQTYERVVAENTANFAGALNAVDLKLQYMNYGGTYANRKCQLWWDKDQLLFDFLPGDVH